VLPLQNALATLTGTGAGLVTLLIAGFFCFVGFWFEMRHHHGARRARGHVYGTITGISAVMVLLNGARLLKDAATSPGKTATALAQSVNRVSSGHAAHAMTARRALEIVGVALAALAAVLVMAAKRDPKPKNQGQNGGPRAIAAGPPALPSGRRGN